MNMHYALKVENILEEADDEFEQATLYVTCNDEGLPVPDFVITGIGGDLSTPDELYPLIITGEGKGDYGSSFTWLKRPKFDRHFYTDLRRKRIEVGTEFSVQFKNPASQSEGDELETTKFRIVERITLAGTSRPT